MLFLLGFLLFAFPGAGTEGALGAPVHVVYTSEVRGTVGICG